MEKRLKAKCLSCGQRFEDKVGGLDNETIYRCQKCGDRKVVSLAEHENTPVPKNCEKCDGALGADLPICPRCNSANVKILKFI